MKDKHKMLHDIAMYDGAVLKEVRGERVYKVRHKNGYLHVDQLLYTISLDWLMPVAYKLRETLERYGEEGATQLSMLERAMGRGWRVNKMYEDLFRTVHLTIKYVNKKNLIKEEYTPGYGTSIEAEPDNPMELNAAEEAALHEAVIGKTAEFEIKLRNEMLRTKRDNAKCLAAHKQGTIGELTNPVQPVPDGPTEDEIRVKSIYGDAFLHVMQSTGTCMVMADPHLRNEVEPISKVSRDGIEAWSSAAHRLEISGLLKVVKAD